MFQGLKGGRRILTPTVRHVYKGSLRRNRGNRESCSREPLSFQHIVKGAVWTYANRYLSCEKKLGRTKVERITDGEEPDGLRRSPELNFLPD